MPTDAKQYTFRLPQKLVRRIEECLKRLQRSGLSVNRTDIVRMLIARGLETTQCDPGSLLGPDEAQKV
jgi:hypothetical protein